MAHYTHYIGAVMVLLPFIAVFVWLARAEGIKTATVFAAMVSVTIVGSYLLSGG